MFYILIRNFSSLVPITCNKDHFCIIKYFFSCSGSLVWNCLYKVNVWLVSCNGQLFMITFFFLEESCVLLLLVPLDLICFSSSLWCAAVQCHVRNKNHCKSLLCFSNIKRRRRMANRSHYFFCLNIYTFASFVLLSWQL